LEIMPVAAVANNAAMMDSASLGTQSSSPRALRVIRRDAPILIDRQCPLAIKSKQTIAGDRIIFLDYS
jgi:hypothetical protein